MSTIVVTPPAAAALVAVQKPSQDVRPGSFTCTWQSTMPGITTLSPTSSTCHHSHVTHKIRHLFKSIYPLWFHQGEFVQTAVRAVLPHRPQRSPRGRVFDGSSHRLLRWQQDRFHHQPAPCYSSLHWQRIRAPCLSLLRVNEHSRLSELCFHTSDTISWQFSGPVLRHHPPAERFKG